ncbi:signal transduction histidine kinase [Catenuloplanes nepalensis]|uniref:histidine kinase n=1 Tax=Catenuloplanes nepalensis TaxID=587533 RepID=A0ABT9N362_9ACTN|nr:sensor histidine kinase [Catenuloplanes nepalensis]MDP9798122.1 signal transduction histidine kinase [Catenuloplanes nepalensis]
MTTTAGEQTWRRPGPTADQRRNDMLIGIAAMVASTFNLVLSTSAGILLFEDPPSRTEQAVWAIACTLPLMWRRRFPEPVMLVIAAAYIGSQVRHAQEAQISQIVLFTAIYTAGAWSRNRRRAKIARAVVIASMFIWLFVSMATSVSDMPPDAFSTAAGPLPPLISVILVQILVNAIYFGFAYYFGDEGWTAAHDRHLLVERAEELRRSQEKESERAVLSERVRIARELHDVVAHHVAVMGVQAAAARRVLDKDADKARTALGAVEQEARTAVDELRRMLGVLRATDADATLPPVHSIDDLPELLASSRQAGLRIEHGVYGDPAVDVPESVSVAAYRIVQEALTNTLKHAGPVDVDVRIRYLSRELEIDVTDSGRATGTPNARGMGLIGMRERVAAHDGVLETGPRESGGFRVRARFPLTKKEVAA